MGLKESLVPTDIDENARTPGDLRAAALVRQK